MQCPQCLSNDLYVESYAYRDHETGYSDSGVKFTCRTCGAVSTAEDMDRAMQTPVEESTESYEAMEALQNARH